jgi:HlyD family secretion protein
MRLALESGMDIERPHVQRRRWVRRLLWLFLVAAVGGGVTLALRHLEPAAPTVDRQSILVGTVQRGVFLRSVQGIGTLAPESEIWVTAGIDGRIQSMPLKPGVQVHPDTILLEMNNPSLELELLQAREALKTAQADLLSRQTEYEDQVLTLKSDISELEDDYKTTQLETSGNEEMSRRGFLPPVKIDLTKLQMAAIRRKIEFKKQSLARYEATKEDRLAAPRGQIEQAQATINYKIAQAKLLKVRAGVEGVLMEFASSDSSGIGSGKGSVGIGKQVSAGTVLAKVVDPRRLRAELKISEQQARDLVVGLPAHLEVLSQTVEGKVTRLDPAVVDGNVAVDVDLQGALPQGSRPDLSITGVIEIERVADAVFVDRPVSATANAEGSLFKLNEAAGTLVRVPVAFGRSSAVTIEVTKGLAPGDKAVVSDMSRWDNVDKLKLE